MNNFAFATPTTLEEAVGLLAENDDARLMAGGVDLVHEMKQGIRTPSLVVHLARVEGLDRIDLDGGRLVIGALAKVGELETNALVAGHAPLLGQAAREVATPQLRTMGTVAGNILQRPQCWYYRDADSFCLRKGGEHCHAVAGDNRYHAVLGGGPCHIVCPSDLAPALLALGAEAVVLGTDGERTIPLGELFVGPRKDPHNEHVLSRTDVITSIAVPTAAGGSATRPRAAAGGGSTSSVFLKARERSAWDFALASVSAVVERGGDGTVSRAAIVLGGVAPNPWNAKEAAAALAGTSLDQGTIAAAAKLAVKGARPLKQNAYKIGLTERLVARALETIADEATT